MSKRKHLPFDTPVPNWSKIRKDLRIWQSMPLVPKLPFYQRFVIIDENKSVKWNQEEVRRINDAYCQAEKDLHTEKNKFKEQLDDLIVIKIVDELGGRIHRRSALKLYSYAYDRSRYSNTDIVDCLIDLLEIIKRVVNCEVVS